MLSSLKRAACAFAHEVVSLQVAALFSLACMVGACVVLVVVIRDQFKNR